MNAWLAGWRLALRMARREVRRDAGRSTFVWLMICLPVAAICASQVIMASQDLASSESVELRLGGAAARLTWTGLQFEPEPDSQRHAVLPLEIAEATDPGQLAEPAIPIPGWGPTITEQQAAVAAWTGQPALALTVGDASVDSSGEIVRILGIDAAQPDAAPIVQLTGGRLPAADDEVLVTPAWTSLGLPASGTVTISRGDAGAVARRIVGTGQVRLDSVIDLVGPPDPMAAERGFLLTGDGDVTWDDAVQFARHGFETTSRGIAADPPEGGTRLGQSPNLYYGGLIGLGGLLEVALVVGPAFAIGAARQRRTLALTASNGADVRQLRRMALGQAVLLGSTASAAGVLLGVAVGAASWPLLSADPTQLYGPLEVPALVGVVLVLGTVTAIASALVPARGLGRLDLVAALRGAARSAPPARRVRRWGAALLVAGLVGTWVSTRLDTLGGQLSFTAWFAAVVVAVTGALLALPSVLVLVGRLSGSAPVVLRIALRDLGRQRGRATATVAAILGGSLLLGVVWTMVASIEADIVRLHIPAMPYGQGEAWSNTRTMDGMKRAVASVEPTLRTAVVGEVHGWSPDGSEGGTSNVESITALRTGCTTDILHGEVEERCRSLGNDNRHILVAEADDLAWLFGLDDQQQAALLQGRILVDTSPPRHPMALGVNELIDGHLRLGYYTFDGSTHHDHTFDIPALAVTAELIDRGSSSGLVGALITTEAAARYNLAFGSSLRVVDPSGPISAELEARLDAAINDPNWGLRVERGHLGSTDPYVWAMTGTLALLAVIAAAVATILATAEQRPFLATFAAVGASPRLSRRLATTQAAVLALLGTLLGFGIGLLAGVPMALSATDKPRVGSILVLPWGLAGILVLAVPAIAATVAALCVPARPTISRRST